MKQVIHIHNPRTAGIAMRFWARNHVPSFQSLYRYGKQYIPGKSRFPHFDPNSKWTYLGHSTAGNLMQGGVFDRKWYDSCYKFVFVRNTWERMVSFFEHERARLERSDKKLQKLGTLKYLVFDDYLKFVMSKEAASRYCNSQSVYMQWGVDFVGRFEDMKNEWKRLCDIVCIGYARLRKRNHVRIEENQRITNPAGWRGFYTPRTRKLVADFYAEEIERFGFSFEE